MSRVVYPARETVTEIRGEDAAEIINKMAENVESGRQVRIEPSERRTGGDAE